MKKCSALMISPGFGNLMSCSLVRCACIALDCQCTQPCVPTVQSYGLSLGTYFDNVHHRSHLSSVSPSPVLVASFWATPKCTLFTYSHIFHFLYLGKVYTFLQFRRSTNLVVKHVLHHYGLIGLDYDSFQS